MADCGVSIFSVNLSGLTTEVTFFPQTGGTVNLGTQTFPFSNITDYYYGTYSCYVPTYAYTYTVVVPAPTPTPTPTATVTPTNTTTPTNTPSVTPTNTSSSTPTNTPTNTITPTQTPSVSPTSTITPTPTRPSTTPTPTSTPIPYIPGDFTFDADYIVVTYAFNDGTDLDTRTRVTVPDIGQNNLSDYIGWCCAEQWPTSSNPILTWGGDNTGTGFESVLIDLIQFKIDYPGQNIITIQTNAAWYGTVGTNPVFIQAKLYKGGTMVADPDNYTFTNEGFTAGYGTVSNGVVVNLELFGNCIDGENIKALEYNLTNYQGRFI
jgi:hypothetical protein